MSELSGFLADDAIAGIRIPAHEFAAAMSGYLIGDWQAGKVNTFLNNLLAEHGEALSVTGETEITNMKSHFDGLTNDGAIKYFTKISWYSVALQLGEMTEVQWDALLHV